MAQEKCPCHPSTIHFITHGSGAWLVVLIRPARDGRIVVDLAEW